MQLVKVNIYFMNTLHGAHIFLPLFFHGFPFLLSPPSQTIGLSNTYLSTLSASLQDLRQRKALLPEILELKLSGSKLGTFCMQSMSSISEPQSVLNL